MTQLMEKLKKLWEKVNLQCGKCSALALFFSNLLFYILGILILQSDSK